MMPAWPRVAGIPAVNAVVRSVAEDFVVRERLGFEASGEGEHVFLHLQKRELTTPELVKRVSRLSGIPDRDIGFSGLKDRNAVTCQWLSVRMAGREEPDWRALEVADEVSLLAATRHQRKLRRGVHRGNDFSLRLRELRGDREELEARLARVQAEGVPNYFGEQRFGRDGSTLEQARRWAATGGSRISRHKRGLYLSAIRGYLFNRLLAARVSGDSWNKVLAGDTCFLQGTRSHFTAVGNESDLAQRVSAGDVHPGLPLWGEGDHPARPQWLDSLAEDAPLGEFLVDSRLSMDWRPARMLADDFCWRFCDDGSLQLQFGLGAGCYATALLAELVQY